MFSLLFDSRKDKILDQIRVSRSFKFPCLNVTVYTIADGSATLYLQADGDACEMLIAAELTLAGIPAMKMPDNWPCYDVIAQPRDGGPPQRISVKSRTFKRGSDTFVTYNTKDQFDWLAIVLLRGADQLKRRCFIVPKAVADARAKYDRPGSKGADWGYWRQDKIAEILCEFEDNFCMRPTGLTDH